MEKNLIPAPIDNKNLCEDPFEDDVFCDGFMAAKNHRKNGVRHLIGQCDVHDEEFPKCVNYWGFVDVSWIYGGHTVRIDLIAVSPQEDWEETRDAIFEHYKNIFSKWMNEDNKNLVVRFGSENDSLFVHFYWSED